MRRFFYRRQLAKLSKTKVCCKRMSDGQSVLVSNINLGPKNRFYHHQTLAVLLMWGVRRPHWGGEDGSIVYNCCWLSPAQPFLLPSPAGLKTIFYSLRFETPPPEGPYPRIYILQEQGGPVIPPGTGFPLRRLVRLAGLRWRYSNPPVRSELAKFTQFTVTLRLSVYRQSVYLGVKPLEIYDQSFFFLFCNLCLAVIVLM
jgi:hypothetical protein